MSVVGAGSVGTAIAYACLIRGSADALALYDTNSAKVRAEVLDLNHGTQFTPPCTVEGGDDISVTAGSDLVVVTAGAKQHPGQSRLELAAVNVKIAQTLTEQLLAVSPDAVLLFVTNPVDVATYAAIQAAGPSYRSRIFGSGTVLDTARLRFLLATELGVAVENVHAFIVGEHGDSEIPLWSSATIGGVPATSFVGPSGGVLGPTYARMSRSLWSRVPTRSSKERVRPTSPSDCRAHSSRKSCCGTNNGFFRYRPCRPVSTDSIAFACPFPRWSVVRVPVESSRYRFQKKRLRGSDLLPVHCERCRNLWDCEYLFCSISDI